MEDINRSTKIVRLARGILSGELDFLEAAVELAGIGDSIGFENARSCLVAAPSKFHVLGQMRSEIG